MNEIQMRQFYQTFPKRDTLRPKLTWSHYRRLISVENEAARLWYMKATLCFSLQTLPATEEEFKRMLESIE